MLKEYREKRDFKRTIEPEPAIRRSRGKLIFVVQKHSARRLHYDFRLELDGVLKSWAVPNGLSDDPQQKHLAVMVEDHPLDYARFEGNIPAGEYGAGEVIIWDQGFYLPEEEGKTIANVSAAQKVIRQGLAEGKLSFTLQGEKLRGSWSLVKMKNGKNNWLIIKHRDEFAGRDALKNEESVVSGRTVNDLKKKPLTGQKKSLAVAEIAGVRKASFPSSASPMLALIAKAPFADPDWFFEPKLDGFRVIALVRSGKVTLISRNQRDVTDQYPTVAASLTSTANQAMTIDGEVVALDDQGRTCFQCLQNRMKNQPSLKTDGTAKPFKIVYYVFDILYLNEYDLTGVILSDRKKILAQTLTDSDAVKVIEYFDTDGIALFKSALEIGLEGVMAKRKNSPYEIGRRSANWLKIKSVQTDDFVIGGFTRGAGNRQDTFGALLIGSYLGKDKLQFAGHVGSGFDQTLLADLRKKLNKLVTDRNPFSEEPHLNAPVTWVKPELVAEIKFQERTQDGYLRIPIFLRLREDKPAREAKTVDPVRDPPAPALKNAEPPLRLRIQNREPTKFADDQSRNQILKQVENAAEDVTIELVGRSLHLTNLTKTLWPAFNRQPPFSKRDLCVYLIKTAPFILPHLRDRPLTLTRYPNGVQGERFYQKHITGTIPDYVKTVDLAEHGGALREYIVCNNLATLLWLAQMANIDIHSWFSRIAAGPDLTAQSPSARHAEDFYAGFPDFIILDIDPYIYSGQEEKGAEPELNQKAFATACDAALWLKESLDGLKLKSFIKTSGRTGFHIHVPILREFDFPAVHSAAKTICEFVLSRHPHDITLDWAVHHREGKIFLDYNQNVRGKTLASAYSPRPTPQATVSAPIQWDEIRKIYPTDFTIATMPTRMESIPDPWSDILETKSDLRRLLDLKSES